eukprot:10710396-Alexandrium_andersonii.AAC.1
MGDRGGPRSRNGNVAKSNRSSLCHSNCPIAARGLLFLTVSGSSFKASQMRTPLGRRSFLPDM